jgi:hypothetical protein
MFTKKKKNGIHGGPANAANSTLATRQLVITASLSQETEMDDSIVFCL